MDNAISFRGFSRADKEACLGLFDANCPEFFAPNERSDFEDFLESSVPGYELCVDADKVVGAFGLLGDDDQSRDLNWIMLDPTSQGRGVGTAIMQRVIKKGKDAGVSVVNIAASHKSAPFFASFGARELSFNENGWGPGMHRVDMELRI